MDEALRALGRAARASEGDLEAGWAFARALERAGERRDLHLELCALARAGEARARDALDRWGDPGAGVEASRVGAPDLDRARVAVIADARLREPARVVGLRERLAYVLADDELLAVDLREARVRWSARCRGLVALRGDDALHAEERALVLRDGQGAVLARADLPWAPDLLAVGGDRAVVCPAKGSARERQPLLALDVGHAFGRALWATEARKRAQGLLVVGPRVVRVTTGWRLERHDLSSGAVTDHGRLLRTAERREVRHVDLAADAATDALLYAATLRDDPDDLGEPDPDLSVVEVDLATGQPRWRLVHAGWVSTGLWTAPASAFVAVGEGPDASLLALERASGHVRWQAPLEDALAVEVAADGVVVATGSPSREPFTLGVLDAATGEVLASRSFEVSSPVGLHRGSDRVQHGLALGPDGLRFVWLGFGGLVSVEAPA